MTAPSIEAAHAMGAKGSPAVEAERLAFEAWMRGHCWALCAVWDGKSYRGTTENGEYVCPRAMRTRQIWAAWRDRAALSGGGIEHPEQARSCEQGCNSCDDCTDYDNDASADCTPNHLCNGRMIHLPHGEHCDKCGG